MTLQSAELDQDERFQRMAQIVQREPTGAIEVGFELLRVGQPHHRALGADLVGQVATVLPEAKPYVATTLVEHLGREDNPAVLQSVIMALGHAAQAATREAVVAFAAHPDDGVRHAVAVALPSLGLNSRAVETLLVLTDDSVDEVRDWATMAIAESEFDSPAIRDALSLRAGDSDLETRSEAIYGLALRGDVRATEFIRREEAAGNHGSLLDRAREALGLA